MGHGRVWAPLLRNSGGVGGCVCSGHPLLLSMLRSMLGLSFSRTRRQRGIQAGSRPASLRARVSKPFEFEARSTASYSLLSSSLAQPEATSLPPIFPSSHHSVLLPLYLVSTRNRISSVRVSPPFPWPLSPLAANLWTPFLSLIRDSNRKSALSSSAHRFISLLLPLAAWS